MDAGTSPSSVAIGDFNSDGKLDLVVSNFTADSISVYLGNGDGTFQPAAVYAVGITPNSVAIGDFNGDGVPDAAVANFNNTFAGTISILLGRGNGTFGPAANFPAGIAPFALTLGDFNRDGKLDVAVTNMNYGADQVSILLGRGDGTLGSPRSIPIGLQPFFITAADFNGDGNLGLAVALESAPTPSGGNDGNLSVLLGNGDGTFQSPVAYSAGKVPSSVLAADFNSDGLPDLAVANYLSSSVSILVGKGDGTFLAPKDVEVSGLPVSLNAADFNQDGKIDLVISQNFSNVLSVLFGNGDGTFTSSVNYGVGSGSRAAAVGDINHDGRLDAVVVNNLSDDLSLLTNICSPNPADNTQIGFAIPGGGANSVVTNGGLGGLRVGYATAAITGTSLFGGADVFGTAVITGVQNDAIFNGVGVPVSPPSTESRIFVDFRSNVPSGGNPPGTFNIDTGIALVNPSSSAAGLTLTLRGADGSIITTGHATLPSAAHIAKFIDQLKDLAPDFDLPANFATTIGFGSLDIQSDHVISVLALRMTSSTSGGKSLITSTPIADLTRPNASRNLFFSQVVDGGGWKTTIVLLNTTGTPEGGTMRFFDDNGALMNVRQINGGLSSTSTYSIPANGVFVFQTDGSPDKVNAGSLQLTADLNSQTPVGAGIFGYYTRFGALATESGIPSSSPTTHARIYVDKRFRYDTGLALANPTGSVLSVTLTPYQRDGVTVAGGGPVQMTLKGNGHLSAFAGQLISGLTDGFKGVLDVASSSPFVALTLRAFDSSITTFPVADLTTVAPTTLLFPQVTAGGDFQTEFIFLNGATTAQSMLSFTGDHALTPKNRLITR